MMPDDKGHPQNPNTTICWSLTRSRLTSHVLSSLDDSPAWQGLLAHFFRQGNRLTWVVNSPELTVLPSSGLRASLGLLPPVYPSRLCSSVTCPPCHLSLTTAVVCGGPNWPQLPVTAQWGVTAEERTEVSLSSQSPSSHCNSITCLQTERILRVRAGFLACPHIPSTHHDVRHTQHTGSAFAGCQGPSKPQVKPHCPKVYHEEKKCV